MANLRRSCGYVPGNHKISQPHTMLRQNKKGTFDFAQKSTHRTVSNILFTYVPVFDVKILESRQSRSVFLGSARSNPAKNQRRDQIVP